MALSLAPQQGAQARELRGTKRPDYKRPEEIHQLTAIMNGLAQDTSMPGQSTLEDKLSATTSGSVRNLENLGGNINGLSAIFGREQEQLRNLGVQASIDQKSDLTALANALRMNASYADKEWDWNEKTPYTDAMKAAEALEGAKLQNIANGLGGIEDFAASMGTFGMDGGFSGSGKNDKNGKKGGGTATASGTGDPEFDSAMSAELEVLEQFIKELTSEGSGLSEMFKTGSSIING